MSSNSRAKATAVAYAYSILGDFGQAEDAAQEAFVQVYRDLKTLREPAAFPAWFRRIVFKHCDRSRRRKSITAAPLRTSGREPVAEEDPAGAAQQREATDKILAAVGALPEKERTATTLFYIDGYSVSEVAHFLGAPVSTVKTRLHSARKRLKERLMAMVEQTLKENAPGDSFSDRVAKALEIYSAKGPGQDSIGSPWHRGILAQTDELLRSGEEGFRVAVALSKSDRVDARCEAAVYFALRRYKRGKKHLERLLKDNNSNVRCRALRAYATLIHPEGPDLDAMREIHRPAGTVPAGIENTVAALDDENTKVRWYAVVALGAYASAGDPRVDGALRKALDDPQHKVRHAAARALNTAPIRLKLRLAFLVRGAEVRRAIGDAIEIGGTYAP
ncbi:MAG: sigma-70 family RNA polymerase sigma factor, partial [Planctomycetota bacterium]